MAIRVQLPTLRYGGDFIVRRHWKLESRVLEEYELVYFPEASGTSYRSGPSCYVLNEPCWILTRPGQEHAYQFSGDSTTRHQFLHFSGGEACAPLLLAPDGPDRLNIREGGGTAEALRHILNIAHSQRDERLCSLWLAALLGELEYLHRGSLLPSPASSPPPCRSSVSAASYPAAASPEATSPSPLYPAVVRQVLAYIRNHLAEPLTVVQIAEHFCFSQEHLTRMFASAIGMPIRPLIIQLRLEKAAHMLRHGSSSIKEIAFECGYSDPHYFSRSFAERFGLPATLFREKYGDSALQHVVLDESLSTPYPLNVYFHLSP
ncbi:helix-turn-helix domain-containing protein [Paenibacillus sp. D51F]